MELIQVNEGKDRFHELREEVNARVLKGTVMSCIVCREPTTEIQAYIPLPGTVLLGRPDEGKQKALIYGCHTECVHLPFFEKILEDIIKTQWN